MISVFRSIGPKTPLTKMTLVDAYLQKEAIVSRQLIQLTNI